MRFVKFGKVNRDFAEKLFLSKNNLGKFAIAKSGNYINICTRKDQRELMGFEIATTRSFIFHQIMVVPIMRKQYHLQIECQL